VLPLAPSERSRSKWVMLYWFVVIFECERRWRLKLQCSSCKMTLTHLFSIQGMELSRNNLEEVLEHVLCFACLIPGQCDISWITNGRTTYPTSRTVQRIHRGSQTFLECLALFSLGKNVLVVRWKFVRPSNVFKWN
jgi:hypothetical protein